MPTKENELHALISHLNISHLDVVAAKQQEPEGTYLRETPSSEQVAGYEHRSHRAFRQLCLGDIEVSYFSGLARGFHTYGHSGYEQQYEAQCHLSRISIIG